MARGVELVSDAGRQLNWCALNHIGTVLTQTVIHERETRIGGERALARVVEFYISVAERVVCRA
jgi:hypothetical protein